MAVVDVLELVDPVMLVLELDDELELLEELDDLELVDELVELLEDEDEGLDEDIELVMEVVGLKIERLLLDVVDEELVDGTVVVEVDVVPESVVPESVVVESVVVESVVVESVVPESVLVVVVLDVSEESAARRTRVDTARTIATDNLAIDTFGAGGGGTEADQTSLAADEEGGAVGPAEELALGGAVAIVVGANSFLRHVAVCALGD
ncbi:MAG: hypothetical protein Q9175_003993 [Cornicularia normoerica]